MERDNPYLIEIEDLCLTRGEKVVFDHLSLKIPRGGITAVMGPSGTGKTTLLRVIGGQVRPDSGSMIFTSTWGCTLPTVLTRLSSGESTRV